MTRWIRATDYVADTPATPSADGAEYGRKPRLYIQLQPATQKLIDATIYQQLADMAGEGTQQSRALRHLIDTEPGLTRAEHTINFLRGYLAADLKVGQIFCPWAQSACAKGDVVSKVHRLLAEGVPGASAVDIANLERFATFLTLPTRGMSANAYLG